MSFIFCLTMFLSTLKPRFTASQFTANPDIPRRAAISFPSNRILMEINSWITYWHFYVIFIFSNYLWYGVVHILRNQNQIFWKQLFSTIYATLFIVSRNFSFKIGKNENFDYKINKNCPIGITKIGKKSKFWLRNQQPTPPHNQP